MDLGGLISSVGSYYDTLLTHVMASAFASTSATLLYFIALIICLVHAVLALKSWAEQHHHDGGMGSLVVAAVKENGKILGILALVAGSPAMFQSIAGSVRSTTSGLSTSVCSSGATVLNEMGDATQATWSLQAVIQNNLAADYPWLFDGLESAASQADDAATVAAKMAAIQTAQMATIDAQIAQATTMTRSADRATQTRGATLLAQATNAKQSLQQAIDQAKAATKTIKATPDDANSVGTSTAFVARAIGSTLSFGLSELALLLKRCAAGVVAFLCVAAPLLLAIMGTWKLLQSLVSLLAQITAFVAVVALAASFGAAVGPLAMLTFLSQRFDRYGHAVISFFFQALGGGVVMSAAIKIAAAGIGDLGTLVAQASSAAQLQIVGTQGLGLTILRGAVAGLGFLLVGLTTSFFETLVQKAPGIGAGVISGSFHP